MFLRRLTSTANRSIINANVCSLAFREGDMDYKKMIIEMVEEYSDLKKEELLYRIISMLEILPLEECKRINDYLSELYFC